MSIDLIVLSTEHRQIAWSLGQICYARPTVADLQTTIAEWLKRTTATHCLVWDARLGQPLEATVGELAANGNDVSHAGLALGTSGLPNMVDYVNPTWMLNADPDLALEGATSWRLALRACLVRTELWLELGFVDAHFETLTGAALELGYRWIRNGALMQHTPRLLADATLTVKHPTTHDELWFVKCRFGRMWLAYAALRACLTDYGPAQLLPLLRRVWRTPAPTTPQPLQRSLEDALPAKQAVSVLIPTIERYPYLFKVLDQLRGQTIPPLEIIVVDQTPLADRDLTWAERFQDLPLRTVWLDKAGQCSSRNTGLQMVRGDYVLFLDDDDEILPDLIETHLRFVQQYDVDASCGVAEEHGSGPLPDDFTYVRMSDVFPTNNGLLKREALLDSGLFDLAYERGSRADRDLGMRLYLAGKKMMLNPDACVVHLHAPRGGLRTHKARVITRGGSRATIRQRQLLSNTEGYLALRYFTPQQARETVWIKTFSSLRGGGTRVQRLLRFGLMKALIVNTYYRNRRALASGQEMLQTYPDIPQLEVDIC